MHWRPYLYTSKHTPTISFVHTPSMPLALLVVNAARAAFNVCSSLTIGVEGSERRLVTSEGAVCAQTDVMRAQAKDVVSVWSRFDIKGCGHA
jgi:hypothetical protein